MSNLKEWLNPLLPAENRVQIADGEIDRLCAQLKASEARAERYRSALVVLACLGNGDRYGNSEGNAIARAALAEGEAS